MDPLSITASIIAVLQAANAVISVCYDYRSALKETPWALTKVADEVKSLRVVLETLEAISRDLALTKTGPQSRLAALELLCAPDGGLLDICLSDLSSLEKKLSSPSWYDKIGPKRRAAIKATGWRLKETDAKEALINIERYKSTLTLAITADEAALLLDIRRTIQSLSSRAADIHDDVSSLLESFNTMRLDDRKQAKLKWLSPVNPATAHNAACKAYQDGNSSWFTDSDEFKQWQNMDHSFLWLSGFPGAGKTVLSSKVINFLHQNKSKHQQFLLFFYCDFRRHDSQDPLNVVGSIVAQLCVQLDAFPDSLDHAFDQSTKVPGPQTRPDLLLLKDVLVSIGDENKVMLVIDALDECNNRAELLSVLVDLQQRSKHINLLVTSRNEADINQAFLSFPRLRLENRSRDVSNDINSYMRKRLNEETKFKWLNDSVKADIEHSLRIKANGMFRWVQCQLDEIAILRTIRSIRKALNDLPEGLYETYENILVRTAASNTEIVRRILLWVAFSIFPMKLWAIWEAIAIEQDLSFLDEEARLSSPRDVIDLCGNLLSVSNKTQEVTMVHLSVKEFLLSPTIRCGRASSFALSPEAANTELALNCLTYLSFTEFQSGPCDTSDRFKSRVFRYPFLDHAARAWPQYTIEAGQPEILNELILRLFDPDSRSVFLSWVQVLNASGVHFWDVFNPDATALYYAASFGLDRVVQRLVNDKVDLNAAASRFGGTALHGAVLRDHLQVVKILLEARADPNKADWNQDSPLHTAAKNGFIDGINLLLSFDAEAQLKDLMGRTPYDWAVLSGQTEAQKVLMQAKNTAKSSSKSKSETIYYCCSCGEGPWSWEKIRRCHRCYRAQCNQCRKQVSCT